MPDVKSAATCPAGVPGCIGEPMVQGRQWVCECCYKRVPRPDPYRYTLTRNLGDLGGLVHGLRLAFVMLNPSTADQVDDDPTIRRCIGFAERERATELAVVNLFALRATDPRELRNHSDPIGPRNNEALRWAAQWADVLVAAWGAHAPADRVEDAVRVLDRSLRCLGTTKAGAPRHPLYLPKSAPLSMWRDVEMPF